jgi:hypothetical protein
MQSKLTHIKAGDKEYPIVFNMNVMEEIQEAYGSMAKWGAIVDNEEGGEPKIKDFKIGLMMMINEGIDIENEITGENKPMVTSKQVGRIISEVGFEEITEVTEIITEVTELIGAQFSEVFDMPKAPKYIPPDVDVDFDKTAIASYKYDPDGNYYYTDDKEAWQSNFGFNEGYDSMAPVTMMFYDTVRTKFNYGGKEWMVQTWKGQYGYAFVGGEVGLYTRKAGSSGSHYNCASKEDWLKMEMLFMWDETGTGVYEPIFQRPYADYWWCTGFVVGFDGHKNRHQFRLMTRITFKDEEMANAFCEAFEKNGFARVDYLDENGIDCFVQAGNEVGFVWQNINQR